MDDIKTSIRGWKGREWDSRVLLSLGTLALYTGTGPAVNIRIDTRLYNPERNELLGCSDSWMRQTMKIKGVKHSMSPCQWDEGPLCSCGCVTVKWGARISQ